MDCVTGISLSGLESRPSGVIIVQYYGHGMGIPTLWYGLVRKVLYPALFFYGNGGFFQEAAQLGSP
jgi:hypothetical protein